MGTQHHQGHGVPRDTMGYHVIQGRDILNCIMFLNQHVYVVILISFSSSCLFKCVIRMALRIVRTSPYTGQIQYYNRMLLTFN